MSRHQPPKALLELATLFLKLGTTAFGGPAAHVAMMEDEVVRRRQWLTRGEFLDLLGAVQLIPGPNSTEMAIHVGHRRAGWPGLIVAGACFILPAASIVTIIAWGYVKFGRLPAAEGVLAGVKPVIIAVVLQALWGLGRTAIKDRLLAVTAVAAATATALGAHELLVLLVCGCLVMTTRFPRGNRAPNSSIVLAPMLPLATSHLPSIAAPGLWPLFGFFLKVGAVLFGSGYVLLAFLRADLVDRWHWLSEAQLLDAIAVGQFTPGPVFTTATFIGYLLAGTSGAAVATLGIFLPAFIFVAISGPLIPRLRRSPRAAAFLDGINAGSLALMAVVSWQLAQSALTGIAPALLAAVSILLLRLRVNSAWLVLGGAVVGFNMGSSRISIRGDGIL